MDVGTISMRYAKAMVEFAIEQKKEDVLYERMITVVDSFIAAKDLRAALNNPLVTIDKKEDIMLAAAGVGRGDDKCLEDIIKLILRNNREDMLQFIASSYLTVYRRAKNIDVATLTTAVPISEKMETMLQERSSNYFNATMEIRTKVDPSIEGGFIFDVNDYRLDASIATQLRRVKQQFIEKNRRIV